MVPHIQVLMFCIDTHIYIYTWKAIKMLKTFNTLKTCNAHIKALKTLRKDIDARNTFIQEGHQHIKDMNTCMQEYIEDI